MLKHVRSLGQVGVQSIQSIGRAGMLFTQSVTWGGPGSAGFLDLIRQIHSVGVRSLSIIIVAGFFVGMVLALQGYNILVKFGSVSALGTMVSLTLLRELGPVLAALLFAGRAGSALTAEIGLMKATEQLSAMEMMGVDPLKRVITPRLWAGVISVPILALLFSTVGIWGGAFVAVDMLGLYDGAYWSNMANTVEFYEDVVQGLIKAAVFGVVVTWIAVYQGYDAAPTSEGIGKATTQTVVISSLAILGLDFILTAVMLGGV
ncbi:MULTISPECIES: lipid asymmetry maintenance ABC transporter permease subunit MlaE [Thalassolituus]|jgi:phospholipid/cholesterol/gamma-HCH transport system permease protein|uniref:lipid asymmetry maintenance ABC transporter permease subunit MlaE n=1 Tax=Thalassolituus TaxID=187492 RepID=UPI0007CFFEFE|nr:MULTISPECIES: lipid asymmetry maintenance ABC transporter permease subunit MlaE [Thalassolituus]KZZ06557.1 ABC transporter permease [Oleibacter sp. HI0075]MAE36095.1 ABC transporter permease [Oceanospirillaceae bacterium]MEC9254330.1 lipid asymmetry maintenance ABC transporter permease subunit MlaE [Pseudomonadota bacterium]MAX88003.1 ABC transporter permease [Oceanospirillaceae bacterium]MBN56695.1 ABC transporter permease [Oceanospirillaceae bacterium]|tara:strand:+ start:1334 stop:2116 length:783 start_codon:yes stop_codon:yes gene_type:complete